MRIRVLGCSGSIAAGSRTTSFLLDGDVLIDAGTGVGDLTLEELTRIDHVLVSHSHLDHVLAIGLLADSVSRRRANRAPIEVHALPATLDALRKHLFNDVIWPDFTRLPSAEQPLLKMVPFGIGDVLDFSGRRVEVLPAVHTVPAVGFAVLPESAHAGAWVFTGDTGPNPALWRRLKNLKVAHLVIETAFGDDEQELAKVSAHLCPSLLARELENLAAGVEVHITHIKPGEVAGVMGQIEGRSQIHRVTALTAAGQDFLLPSS
jgi:ribonuclease BN (tRNA processing enzyme)